MKLSELRQSCQSLTSDQFYGLVRLMTSDIKTDSISVYEQVILWSLDLISLRLRSILGPHPSGLIFSVYGFIQSPLNSLASEIRRELAGEGIKAPALTLHIYDGEILGMAPIIAYMNLLTSEEVAFRESPIEEVRINLLKAFMVRKAHHDAKMSPPSQ